MFRQTTLAVLIASAAVAAPVPKALYHPTTVGAVSVFDETDNGKKSERTDTVTKVEVEGGVYRVTTHMSYGKKVVGWWETLVSEGGVATPGGGAGRDQPMPWLKLTAKPGDSWQNTFDGGVESVTLTFVGEEEVEVPAGKFKALRVDSYRVTAKFGQKIRTSAWVVPEIGMVKGFSNSGGGPDDNIVSELKSFTPGDGKAKGELKRDK